MTVVEDVAALKSASAQIIKNQKCLLDWQVDHLEFPIIEANVTDLESTLETLPKNQEA